MGYVINNYWTAVGVSPFGEKVPHRDGRCKAWIKGEGRSRVLLSLLV